MTIGTPTTHRADGTSRAIKEMPALIVRVEPNVQGTHILWSVSQAHTYDGTVAKGFAATPAEAMRDAAEFVEAMMQPRLGGLFKKPELKLLSGDKGPKPVS